MGAEWLNPARPFAGGAREGLTGRPLAWSDWLARGLGDEGETERWQRLRAAMQTGRPCGGEEFVRGLEGVLGRPLEQRRRGPRPRVSEDVQQMDLF